MPRRKKLSLCEALKKRTHTYGPWVSVLSKTRRAFAKLRRQAPSGLCVNVDLDRRQIQEVVFLWGSRTGSEEWDN